ncbi:MAG: hypothetical protein WAW03_23770 [Anaerolineae bacterium]|jgi:hypothetical protein
MSDEKTVQASHDDQRGGDAVNTPDPEVVPKAERRRRVARHA